MNLIHLLRKSLGTAGLSPKLDRLLLETRISSAFSRAAATAAARRLDPLLPETWEFSGFSQHGEDGIIDHLASQLLESNRFFFEIGSADGLENSTSWLALARSWAGVMIEGNPALSRTCEEVMRGRAWNVNVLNRMVGTDNILSLLKMCPYPNPDLFSLDIDGIDYHILTKVLESGCRPKIILVEYNSAFGPHLPVTVPYQAVFERWTAHPSGLYYGASFSAWLHLMRNHGYNCITTDASGTNMVFIDPAAFPDVLASMSITPVFRNNTSDANGATQAVSAQDGTPVLPPRDWTRQFKLIEHLPLEHVASPRKD